MKHNLSSETIGKELLKRNSRNTNQDGMRHIKTIVNMSIRSHKREEILKLVSQIPGKA